MEKRILRVPINIGCGSMMRYLSGKDIHNEQEENADELDEANRMKREEHERLYTVRSRGRNLNSEKLW
ncbi:hypothetical protein CEXT_248161 [Caerostris extrusa]|uniref:Uncharacterized protein n=1 Tax=Caerostris extrusa TaxID=172846 RepID=A0AAV4XRM9_CAEEX|nr:hypothetical protein CEXT_248161 [Caerostris extrusa]